MRNFLRHSKQMMAILLLIILGGLLIIAGVLYFHSSGNPGQYLDKDGKPIINSIFEKIFVTIGGVKQGLFIKSKDFNKPVLLYVHGGPAFSNYFLFEKYKPGLEDYFTVCYWDQRGGGLSYRSDIPIESMSFEQLTADAIEVTNYLRHRFAKEKIYLMAHSGGTPIAIQAAATAPQLYKAYIGMGQITRQSESERIAYKFIVEQYTKTGNKKGLKELSKYPVLTSDTSFTHFYKSMIRDQSMHELGIGTMRNMKSIFWGVFIPVWMCNAYTIREKINIWVSKFTFITRAKFVDQLFTLDIPVSIPTLDIPVYFFSGKYDLTVNVDLSKAYLGKLHAPVKGFYTFENSAHSPLFEEPLRVKEIIEKDVLNGKNSLADK